jgi:DNA-binding IclR family transcriptional regulator
MEVPGTKQPDDVERTDRPLRSIRQIPSAGKALVLLEVFVGNQSSLGVTEVARAAGITKSTAFRLLGELVEHGYLTRRGARYGLSERLFELGSYTSCCRPHSLRDTAIPFLSNLYAEYKATVHLAVLDDGDPLYLAKLHGPTHVNTPTHVGSKMPASVTAVGKALVAFSERDEIERALARPLVRRTPYSITQPHLLLGELEQIRALGYAADREESTLGVHCYAAPIVQAGRLVAAVSVCTTSSASGTQLVTAVRTVADRIGRAVPTTSMVSTIW